MEENLESSFLDIETLAPPLSLLAARPRNEVRLEYIDSCRDAVLASRASGEAFWAGAAAVLAAFRFWRYLMMVALSAYLTKSRGKYQMMFQTQTIPIHPPEIARTHVNHQFPYAAMMEEISWAIQKATMRAVEGRSVHEGP